MIYIYPQQISNQKQCRKTAGPRHDMYVSSESKKENSNSNKTTPILLYTHAVTQNNHTPEHVYTDTASRNTLNQSSPG